MSCIGERHTHADVAALCAFWKSIDPFRSMTRAEKAKWRHFKKHIPWLGGSDRQLVRIACNLNVRFETSPSLGVIAELRRCLSSMGGTPADRSRIALVEDSEQNEIAQKYFSRSH